MIGVLMVAGFGAASILYNQMVPWVRKSDWTIDVSGRTRRTGPGFRFRFGTSALPVLALVGGRTDLQTHVDPQVKIALLEDKGATDYRHPAYSCSYGTELTPTYLVLTSTKGW